MKAWIPRKTLVNHWSVIACSILMSGAATKQGEAEGLRWQRDRLDLAKELQSRPSAVGWFEYIMHEQRYYWCSNGISIGIIGILSVSSFQWSLPLVLPPNLWFLHWRGSFVSGLQVHLWIHLSSGKVSFSHGHKCNLHSWSHTPSTWYSQSSKHETTS